MVSQSISGLTALLLGLVDIKYFGHFYVPHRYCEKSGNLCLKLINDIWDMFGCFGNEYTLFI